METVSAVESKYKFADFKNGFTISAKERKSVHVKFDGMTFSCVLSPSFEPPKWAVGYGMFEFSKLMQQIVQTLMTNWKPRPDGKAPYRLRLWAMTNTTKALAKKVNARRLALMTQTDQRYVNAQRAYYACSGKYHVSLTQDALYKEENKYVLADICKYRAAAMTVPDMLFYNNKGFQGWESGDNWMSMYCKNNKANTSLRKTLMNLPGGIPYQMLKRIAIREPDRPYYNRLELLSYLQVLDCQLLDYHSTFERNVRIVNRSTAKQIRKALHMIYAHLRQEKTQLRKTITITRGINFIFDCTDEHNGHIVGMANKSIKWHRAGHYLREAAICKFPASTVTKTPPIPLPTNKCIRFLNTVQAIFDESVSMQHCVSGYAEKAVKGDCYLFHIDYRQKSATVEVSPRGSVTQSRGPYNCDNMASRWGEKILSVWAQKLPVGVTTPRVHDDDPLPGELERLFVEIPF